MGVVGVLIGALVGVGTDAFSQQFSFNIIVGSVIVYFFMAAGNMMNDYFDRNLDRINHPERPIPSGDLQASSVRNSAIFIFVLLIILGLLVNFMMFIILIVSIVLMLGYEVSLKSRGLVGNITISILVGLLFMFGAAAVSEYGVVIFLSLLAFLATLTREIVKDIQDIEGDIDRKTVPKKIGIRNACILAIIILVIAIIFSPIPAFPEWFPIPYLEFEKLSIYYLYFIIPSDIVFIISMGFFCSKPNIGSQVLKGGMALALVAFVLGSIIV
jgi:geranylgeranylglycerol-phosphate geranylgeranyltransferase